MFVYDGLAGASRTIQLRQRQTNCVVCGDHPSVSSLVDYEVFCSSHSESKNSYLLNADDRVSCRDYYSLVKSKKKHLLIDVRPRTEFEICHLDNAICILTNVITVHCIAIFPQLLNKAFP